MELSKAVLADYAANVGPECMLLAPLEERSGAAAFALIRIFRSPLAEKSRWTLAAVRFYKPANNDVRQRTEPPCPNRPSTNFAQLPPPVLRQLIRRGDYTGHTSGLGQRHLQANLVILQKSWADEFLRFCALNPWACPLLDVSEPGSPHFARLGADIDVRSDLPRYRVHRRGQSPSR